MATKKDKKPTEVIDFFQIDPAMNVIFNADFHRACEQYDEEEMVVLKNLILAYRDVVPLWNYPTALSVLNIADMEIQKQEVLKQFKKKAADDDRLISRNDTEMIKQLGQAIEIAKKEVGIDPKTLATKGDGSLSEAFADVVSKMSFNQKRSVFKPIFGLKDRGTGSNPENDPFKGFTEEEVKRYLETATE
jgi:hypothetical protein